MHTTTAAGAGGEQRGWDQLSPVHRCFWCCSSAPGGFASLWPALA